MIDVFNFFLYDIKFNSVFKSFTKRLALFL
jgi:hypothetical protein